MMGRLCVAAAVALASLALTLTPTAASAADPPTLSQLEGKVNCLVCGTSLAVAQGPGAEQVRQVIRDQIAAGASEQQILDRLVAEYGPAILSDPGTGTAGGRSLLAVVIAAALIGAAAVAAVTLRWRRRPAFGDGGRAAGGPAAAAAPPPDPAAEPDPRLRAALSDLD